MADAQIVERMADAHAQIRKPYKYEAFPRFLYHPCGKARLVASEEEAKKLGPIWRREPYGKEMQNADGDKLLVFTAEQQRAAAAQGWTEVPKAKRDNE